MPLTPGKIRALQTLSDEKGIFKILAADHRDSLRVLINPHHPEQVPASTLTHIKRTIVQDIAPHATAVMLDPVYSAAQLVVDGSMPGQVGFLCALEAQGYQGNPTARETQLLEGWSVEKAKRLGASGIKLLIYYHPDADEAAEKQQATVQRVVGECQRYDIPLFLEPLFYSLDPTISVSSEEFARTRRHIVVETVRQLSTLQPDVLKIQFPLDGKYETNLRVWRDACMELETASQVPWALLSGGDPYEMFKLQLQIACESGCSGFMVGRALWREIVTAPAQQHDQILQETILPRFHELSEIADAKGGGWQHKHHMPNVDEHWYLDY